MAGGTRSKDKSIGRKRTESVSESVVIVLDDSDGDDQSTTDPATNTSESSILKQQENRIEDLEIEVEELKDKLSEKTELIKLYKENNDDHEAKEKELAEAVKELQRLLNKTVDDCEILLMEKEKENETLKLQIKTMHEEARGRELAVVNASEDLNKNFQLRKLYGELDCYRQQIAELQRINRTLVDEQSHALRLECKRMNEIEDKDKWKNRSSEIQILREKLTASEANEVRWRQLASSLEEAALKSKDDVDESNLNTQVENADVSMFDANLIEFNEVELQTSDQEHTNEMEVHSSYLQELARHKDDLRKCKEELERANEQLNKLQGQKDCEKSIFEKDINEHAAEINALKEKLGAVANGKTKKK